MPVEYGSLPFDEAIDYLRDKVNLPTASWTDIWEGQHARAFAVAGATKDELLVDLREAVRGALEDGETLEQFRKRFDAIAKSHGWAYNGGRNWRTRTIYKTNMRTAYNAGRYQQMQAVKRRRPYWQYKHADFVKEPRPEHLAWDGLVLPADDPWWDTHFPQNGWGCECSVRALSERDLKRLGKDGPDTAPPIEWEEKTVGIRGPNPRTVRVPQGIDPGWAYNVGKSATGEQIADAAMDEWRDTKDQWRRMIASGWAEAGRPSRLPAARAPVGLGPVATSEAEVIAQLREQLGGPSKSYQVAGLPIEIHADILGKHLADDLPRSRYLPLLEDAVTRPQEVWLNFEAHTATGQIRLVARMVKTYALGRDRNLVVVTAARKGTLVSHTLIETRDRGYANRQRQGKLLYSEEDGAE